MRKQRYHYQRFFFIENISIKYFRKQNVIILYIAAVHYFTLSARCSSVGGLYLNNVSWTISEVRDLLFGLNVTSIETLVIEAQCELSYNPHLVPLSPRVRGGGACRDKTNTTTQHNGSSWKSLNNTF